MNPKYEIQKAIYETMWKKCAIHPNHGDDCDRAFEKAITNKPRYDAVELETKVPRQLIAGIHMRESTFNFKGGFCNGDPWDKVTVNHPPGRGPFASWEDSAVDAIKQQGLNMVILKDSWTLPRMLWHGECWNGAYFLKKGIPSPYLWSFTTLYEKGKFASDGKFDPELVDKQVGIAALFLRFQERNML